MLKKQNSLGKALSLKSALSVKNLLASGAKSLQKAASFKKAKPRDGSARDMGTSVLGQTQAITSPMGTGHAAEQLVKQASLIKSARERWAGTMRISDEEFDSRFFVREKLGEGSFGEVRRVIRVSDGAELAAKILTHGGHDAEWAEVLEEARVWSVVSSPYHPSILPLLEVLEVEGRALHLITELMPCAVLGDAIFNVVISEQAARLIMVQLTSAVAHLHLVHGMAHRDLKPDVRAVARPEARREARLA